MKKKTILTHAEAERLRVAFNYPTRLEAKRQLKTVTLILTCLAALVLWLAWHLLNK